MRRYPSVSIITPVYNGGIAFVDCLSAIKKYKPLSWELIVVDDGSTDRSAATAAGATIYTTGGRMGPGYARNLGAQHARGDYLFFIDADCEVNEFTFENLAEELNEYPDIDAFFGSYDDSPRAPNFVAQYKNLCHRYVHQLSNENASTFWAGCGIVKRTTFMELGGFDVNRFNRPSIEDIDLGYRIRQAGGRIRIAKSVQVKHYKAWNLANLIKVDIVDRGIPWTRLLLANPWCRVSELNLQLSYRVSVISAFLLVACVLACLVKPVFLLGALASAMVFCSLNRDIFRYFYEYRGLGFMIKVIPMQLLFYFYAGIAFALGVLLHYTDRFFGRDPFLLAPQPPLRANVRELRVRTPQ
jgi:glycosyltransferase involved in cell wall biosynthesis